MVYDLTRYMSYSSISEILEVISVWVPVSSISKVSDSLGCSISSTHQPLGVVRFGDTPQSLPSQLGLTKFSYCLLSHFYDDTKESTDLILDLDGELEAKGLSYTPLIPSKSVSTGFHFYGYRYVILLEIVVGDTHVMIPDKFRVLGPDGNGGTILDAGSPYTYMERSIYQNVSEAFESQMGRYAGAPDIGVLGSCFQLIPNEVSLYYPPLTLILI
ncbi:aspartic proteinase nepenthesin-2-like [Quercus robur]|uniref:aspartic proteinase nepenthesin-2-like n=1 Tax=Quercus robur TaxID=38942 RepID=UPI002162F998|nr:aspartic proteinase nepenthesin-2-like [Quercus robur]